MKPASYNKPCWCVYWSTDPRTDIIQTSKQRTTQRNHEPPCLRVSILHHHHLATSIESLSSPLPPAPWPSPGPAPTSPRRSWAGTAARSPRAAPPAGWRGDQGLPSCRRGRGKLLALGPRYKTKLIFPAADPCPCLGLLSRPHPDWTRLTAPPRRPRQLRQRPPPSYKSKFAAHDFSDLGQSAETPPWLLTLDANQWWVFHFLFHFNIVHAPSLWLSSF